jgi:membrane-associated phospholipid phosphatase
VRQILQKASLQDSMTSDGRVRTRFVMGTIVCYVLLVTFYVVLVGTNWGHEFDDDAFLGRGALNRHVVPLDLALLMPISNATIMIASSVLFLVSVVRRRVLVGLLAIAGFFAAVIGAEILKDLVFPWRPLVPDDARLVQDLQLNSYPSGHATIATSFLLALLMVSPARWRSWLGPVAGAFSSIFATGVLFAGWHRASDALGALAWSGVCMNLAATVAVRLRGRPVMGSARPPLSGSVALGVVLLVAFFLVAATAPPEHPVRNLPFFLLTGLIIVSSFILTAWYSRQFEAVDFRGARGLEVRSEK